jgi:hypothetical protein
MIVAKEAIKVNLNTMVYYTFVNNTDIIQPVCNMNQEGEAVVSQIQATVNRWEGRLRVTGDVLVANISHWYLINSKWTEKMEVPMF